MATVSVDLETMVGNDNSLINERWELVAWPESTTGSNFLLVDIGLCDMVISSLCNSI